MLRDKCFISEELDDVKILTVDSFYLMVLLLRFKLGISGMLGEHSAPELHPEL